jgi:hypothetical protein
MNGKIWNMIILTKMLKKNRENIKTTIKETKQQLIEKDEKKGTLKTTRLYIKHIIE